MSALKRGDQNGLFTLYEAVNTGASGAAGGGFSTLTVSVEDALAEPLSAVTERTYSPVFENDAVVVPAVGSANVTSPGPETSAHCVFGSGPDGGGGAAGGVLPRPAPPRPRL